MKIVEYFLAPQSPYCYLGHAMLTEIAQRTGATIQVKPIDLGQIFPVSGGLPLPKRSPQRQAYRLVELERWSAWRARPLHLHPAFFPVAGDDAARLIIAADLQAGWQAAMRLAGAIMTAVWAEQRNIADPATLIDLARDSGLDAQALASQRDAAQARYEQYTQQALQAQVFGAPWFVVDGKPFWGQDRLKFVERALSQAG
jgi:2-hydroxychromene-2-carboxylate isomerase